jgi:hypothetical protein
MCTVSRHHKNTKDTSATNARNAAVEVARLMESITLHKQIVVYISQNTIPRIHQLLGVQLRAGSSIMTMMEKLVSAVSGVYHAKGFTPEDVDASTMVWRIGGPRCLAMLCSRDGSASLRGCVGGTHLFRLSSKGFNEEHVLASISAGPWADSLSSAVPRPASGCEECVLHNRQSSSQAGGGSARCQRSRNLRHAALPFPAWRQCSGGAFLLAADTHSPKEHGCIDVQAQWRHLGKDAGHPAWKKQRTKAASATIETDRMR